VSIDQVRAVADAVLYEGYLLYPYRASSAKNQSRWQFGVLGPPGAARAGVGEEPAMTMQCLLDVHRPDATVTVHLRFLQLQTRQAERREPDGRYVPVSELTVAGHTMLSWDEAVEREEPLAPLRLGAGMSADAPVDLCAGHDVELLEGDAGRVVRRRWPLTASVRVRAEADDGLLRLSVTVRNDRDGADSGTDIAIRSSLIGAHVVLEADGADFVSLLEPPAHAEAAAGRCRQDRCWPVLAGPAGTTDLLLGAPIILYDHPQVAEQSPGALFDSTEIDEILTLRVMTMTDEEKAEARATDPRARALIDRCDAMSPADLQKLHGVFRDPHARLEPHTGPDPHSDDVPWWDPAADAAASPGTDAVLIDGVRVARDSVVRVHPSRRADAQDLFFADQLARVTAVLGDVDGGVHVALVLLDDPAADLHDEAGRYFYFAPDELEPVPSPRADQPAREDQR
jgi:hypothetical protein